MYRNLEQVVVVIPMESESEKLRQALEQHGVESKDNLSDICCLLIMDVISIFKEGFRTNKGEELLTKLLVEQGVPTETISELVDLHVNAIEIRARSIVRNFISNDCKGYWTVEPINQDFLLIREGDARVIAYNKMLEEGLIPKEYQV